MQYILTEKEYSDLKLKKVYDIGLSKDKLQTLCTKIANEMPIKFWGRAVATPWVANYLTIMVMNGIVMNVQYKVYVQALIKIGVSNDIQRRVFSVV